MTPKKMYGIDRVKLNYCKYKIWQFFLISIKNIQNIFKFSMLKKKWLKKKWFWSWNSTLKRDAKRIFCLVFQIARGVQKTLSELANARESAELRLERQQQNTKEISFSRILSNIFLKHLNFFLQLIFSTLYL